MERLPLHRAVVLEVLRISGPAPLMGLETQESVSMAGVVFPKGTSILVLTRHMSMTEVRPRGDNAVAYLLTATGTGALHRLSHVRARSVVKRSTWLP